MNPLQLASIPTSWLFLLGYLLLHGGLAAYTYFRVLRYGTARDDPDAHLWALGVALSFLLLSLIAGFLVYYAYFYTRGRTETPEQTHALR